MSRDHSDITSMESLDNDEADKKRLDTGFNLIYFLNLISSYYRVVASRNNPRIYPVPTFAFRITTFRPHDQTELHFSNFDPSGITRCLTEEELDCLHEARTTGGPSSSLKPDSRPTDYMDAEEILDKLVNEKRLDLLQRFKGAAGLAASLQTNLQQGIQADHEEICLRRYAFGTNNSKPPTPCFACFIVKVPTCVLLVWCAVLLGLGIKKHDYEQGRYISKSLLLLVYLAYTCLFLYEFWQNRELGNRYASNDIINVEVVRSGRRQKISFSEIVVGDVVFSKAGDKVPADGLFLDPLQSIHVDESVITGENCSVEIDSAEKPFLFSGSKVVHGYGKMLVTSVGRDTRGAFQVSHSGDVPGNHPMDKAVSVLFVLAVVTIVLASLLIDYYTGGFTATYKNIRDYTFSLWVKDGAKGIMKMLATCVIICLPALGELAFVCLLDHAYSLKRMVNNKVMVRNLSACEELPTATTICTNKTGILTVNEMKVAKFWVGHECIEESNSSSGAAVILKLMHQGVGLNTSGGVSNPTSGSELVFSGSPTEQALLTWGVKKLKMNLEELKESCTLLHVETFNPIERRSSIILEDNTDNTVHGHWKGAAEEILDICSYYYKHSGEIKTLDDTERRRFSQLIEGMAASGLRCIAFAHKEASELRQGDGRLNTKVAAQGLTLLGLVGLKNPCRPGVKNAVEAFQHSGIQIKMMTGDNIFTARAIAAECGILKVDQDTNEGQVIEGGQFRIYSMKERMEKVDQILVIARASPYDKRLLVECLKKKQNGVGVVGGAANDAPLLKMAGISFAMGIHGTEVAKESSDFVMLDNDLASVAYVLRCSRYVRWNIERFFQLQLSMIIASLWINFISVPATGYMTFTVLQVLWVNIVVTLLVHALMTEEPTPMLAEEGSTESTVNKVSWGNFFAQLLYLATVLLILQKCIDKKVRNTLIFNTLVLFQFFNLFNARRLEQKNIFQGIHKSKLSVLLIGVAVVLHVGIMELMNKFENIERLNRRQWGLSIGLAAASWLIGLAVKYIVSDN